MTWLTENPWPLVILFGILALIFVFLWSGRKQVLHLLIAACLLLMAVAAVVIEQYIVTDAERVEQHVLTLTHAFQMKDLDTVRGFFSPQALELRSVVEGAAKLVTVRNDLRISDLSVEMKAKNSRAIARFRANASIDVIAIGDVGYQATRWELVWQREAAEWKIIQVIRLNPLNGEEVDIMSSSK